MLSRDKSLGLLTVLLLSTDLIQARSNIFNKKNSFVEHGEFLKLASDSILGLLNQIKPWEKKVKSPSEDMVDSVFGPVGCSMCWMGVESVD